MTNSQDDYYKQTTQTVRTSYRLLHDYQRLILDGCQYLGRELNLVYEQGQSRFSDVVQRRNKDLKKWSWDWLPFYSYEMSFGKEVEDGRVHLSMVHIADTAGHATERSQRTDTQTMGSASQSHSLIVFVYALQAQGDSVPQRLDSLECHYPNDKEETYKTRQKFLDKCVLNAHKEKSFKQEGLCIMPVPVEEILSQEGADRVVARLKAIFCALG